MITGQQLLKSIVHQKDVYTDLKEFVRLAEEYTSDNTKTDIVAEYLQCSFTCSELLDLLQGEKKSTSELRTIFNAIEQILLRISDDLTSYQNTGIGIVEKFLLFCRHRLRFLLHPSSKSYLIKSILKLLTAVIIQGRNAARDVITLLDLQIENILDIMNKKSDKDPEDIRTCILRFIVALLVVGENDVIRRTVEIKGLDSEEAQRNCVKVLNNKIYELLYTGFLNAVFPGLIYDRSSSIHLILSTMQRKIVENPVISKTQKIKIFNNQTLKYVLQLYLWKGVKRVLNRNRKRKIHSEDVMSVVILPATEKEIEFVRDTAHQFMKAVCCSYKYGIVFSDFSTERNPNHIITILLEWIRQPYADCRFSDLIIHVLQTCPDQMIFYLPSLKQSVSPHHSSTWIQVIDFMKKIVSNQFPLKSLLRTKEKRSVNSLAEICVSLCVPSILSRDILSSYLKNPDHAIRYTLLDYLQVMLKKLKETSGHNEIEFTIPSYTKDEVSAFQEYFRKYAYTCIPDISSVYQSWEDVTKDGLRIAGSGILEYTEDAFPTYTLAQMYRKLLEVMQMYTELCPFVFENNPFKFRTFLEGIRTYSAELKDDTTLFEISVLKLLIDSDPRASHLKLTDEFPFSFLMEFYLKINDYQLLTSIKKILRMLFAEIGVCEKFHWEIDIWLKKLKSRPSNCHTKISKFLETVINNLSIDPALYENEILKSFEKVADLNTSAKSSTEDIENITYTENCKSFSCMVPAALQNAKDLSFKYMKVVQPYLTEVLEEILYHQHNPKPFCVLLCKYNVLLPSLFMDYINIWIPSHYQVDMKEVSEISLSDDLFSRLSASSSLKTIYFFIQINDVSSCEKFVSKKFKHYIKKSENYEELQSITKQIIFYITSEIQSNDKQEETRILFLISLLNIIMSNAKRKSLKNSCDDNVVNNVHEYSLSDFVTNIITTDSVVLKWFLPSTAEYSKLSKTVMLNLTSSIFNLVTFANEIPKLKNTIILKPYKDKLVSYVQNELHQKEFMLKETGFARIVKEFIHVLDPKEVMQILQVFTKFEFSYIQQLDPDFSGFIQLIRHCSEDKTLNFMDLSTFRSLYFNILNYFVEKAESNELIDILLQMIYLHPSSFKSVDVQLVIPLLKNPISKHANVLKSLMSCDPSLAVGIAQFMMQKIENLDQLPPQSLIEIVNACIEFLNVDKKYIKFLKAISTYYWCATKKIIHSVDDIWSGVTINSTMHILLVENLIDGKKVVSFTKKLHQNFENGNIPSIATCRIIIELFHCLDSLKINIKSVSAGGVLLKILVKWLLHMLKVKEENNQGVKEILTELINLIKKTNYELMKECLSVDDLWSLLLKTLLKKALRNAVNGPLMLKLLSEISSTLYIKSDTLVITPSVLEIHEMVFGHSNFMSVMLDEVAEYAELKEALVDLILRLTSINSFVCKKQNIPIFLGAYHATLSNTDQSILHLISLYEKSGIQLVEFRPFIWGTAAINHYSVKQEGSFSLWKELRMEEVITLIDPNDIWYSVLHFPLNLDLEPTVQKLNDEINAEKTYDPRFLLSLFSYLLSPGRFVNCWKFIDSRCLAFVISALSSHISSMRETGYYILYQFYEHLEGSIFRDKDLWIGILKLIKYSLEKDNERLPCLITQFLSKITDFAFKAEDPMFQPLFQFMTLKSTLDLHNVPEFYTFFNNTDILHYIKQNWILNLLVDGMRSSLDFHICEKRYIFQILLSFYNSPVCAQQTKILILNILQQTVKIPPAAQTLQRKYGILAWISNVIYNSQPSEEELLKLKCIVNTLQETNSSDSNKTHLLNATWLREVTEWQNIIPN